MPKFEDGHRTYYRRVSQNCIQKMSVTCALLAQSWVDGGSVVKELLMELVYERYNGQLVQVT